MITRVEKDIDLTKKSWWRAPRFLFEENQNYSKIVDCKNKETFPETLTQDFEIEILKNVVVTSNKIEHLIPSTVGNIIKANNYSQKPFLES